MNMLKSSLCGLSSVEPDGAVTRTKRIYGEIQGSQALHSYIYALPDVTTAKQLR